MSCTFELAINFDDFLQNPTMNLVRAHLACPLFIDPWPEIKNRPSSRTAEAQLQ